MACDLVLTKDTFSYIIRKKPSIKEKQPLRPLNWKIKITVYPASMMV